MSAPFSNTSFMMEHLFFFTASSRGVSICSNENSNEEAGYVEYWNGQHIVDILQKTKPRADSFKAFVSRQSEVQLHAHNSTSKRKQVGD